MSLSHDDFRKVEIHVGRVLRAEPFPDARQPAIKLWIDFGAAIGTKKTSARLAADYTPEQLTGRLVVAVTNFPPKQIGRFMSEVLVLGVPDATGAVVLLQPDRDVPAGGRVY
jgi:tRNA-binding protein